MTASLITDKGMIWFEDPNLEPLTECFHCQSKELTHDFSAGFYSDRYCGSECKQCGAVKQYAMGVWMTTVKGEETIAHLPEHHPLYKALQKNGKVVKCE